MEAMNKCFLVSVLLVLVAVHAHAFFPFDSESASEFSQETQDFPWKSPSDSDETSLLSVSELPQYSDPSSFSLESDFPQETQDFPWKKSKSSESGFYQEFESPVEYFPREIDADHKVYSPPPSLSPSPSPTPTPTPSPSPSEAPYPPKNRRNTCKSKCSRKCLKEKYPLLHILCKQLCKTSCILPYSERVYNCTSKCAESMPRIFKSDEKRAAAYVKHCYRKCTKNL